MDRVVPAIFLLFAAGCIAPRAFPPAALSPGSRLVPVAATSSFDGVTPASASDERTASMPTAPRRPRDVLVLTGGGMFGAYSAGVLNGWTAAGNRPEFDVVTGVSTGALVAIYAFLGPAYDDRLEESYTTIAAQDIYVRRYLATALLRDALADSTPLQRRIEREVTPDLLQRVADAHVEGRRLYVGTTNLDSKRFVVWDMGAIAAGPNPDKLRIFREVILASCSVPGLLPPVAIDVEIEGVKHTELHVDGGVTASAFLRPDMLGPPGAVEEGAAPPRVHIVVAGRMRTPAVPVKRRLLDVSTDSLRAAFQARWEGDLLRLFVASHDCGAEVRVAAVQDCCLVKGDEMTFDAAAMKTLFAHGQATAEHGDAWRPLTPELLAEGIDPPREGVRFAVEHVASDDEPIRRPAVKSRRSRR